MYIYTIILYIYIISHIYIYVILTRASFHLSGEQSLDFLKPKERSTIIITGEQVWEEGRLEGREEVLKEERK